MKKELLLKAQIDSDKVVFLECDFETQNWAELLLNVPGYDPSKSTFILLEGVTYYLTPSALKQNFQQVMSVLEENPTSQFSFDYYRQVNTDGLFSSYVKLVVSSLKEPFLSSIPSNELEEFVNSFHASKKQFQIVSHALLTTQACCTLKAE
jgi:O-methyltransferase involved in polyketide biosynthesis